MRWALEAQGPAAARRMAIAAVAVVLLGSLASLWELDGPCLLVSAESPREVWCSRLDGIGGWLLLVAVPVLATAVVALRTRRLVLTAVIVVAIGALQIGNVAYTRSLDDGVLIIK